MARYINCKKCIHYKVCVGYTSEQAMEETTKAINGENCLPCEEYLPTADVVPKSEVAREIFEEMQSCLIQRHWNGLDIVSFEFDAVKYAELKKKYTESEDKE